MTMSARQKMHERHCRLLRCRYTEYRLDYPNVSEECILLDAQIEAVETEHTQAAAQRLLDMSKDVMLVHGSAVVQGLLLAYKTIAPDPYYKEPQS